MERQVGIEPTSLAWKAMILPLNYCRVWMLLKALPRFIFPFLNTQTTMLLVKPIKNTLRPLKVANSCPVRVEMCF